MTTQPSPIILSWMSQLPLFQPQRWALSVTDITRYVREVLESDQLLQDVWVQGEVSNISRPSSGHMYFTLKDSGASLRCVMWRPQVMRQAYLPQAGEALEVHGNISVYEAGGQYQLYADSLRPMGEGLLYQRFMELKERLEREGLFDPERKRPIPTWPRRLGVVTSPTGAALQDILHTLERRFPLPKVVLAPTLVQGDEAPDRIVEALERLNTVAVPDVILLARGGGSLEDLWAFNDERVVRAVAGSRAPVITGVGHETDFTLADFAADLRAATPTAAAELATPNKADLQFALAETDLRMQRALQTSLRALAFDLGGLRGRLARVSPFARIQSGRQRVDEVARRLTAGLAYTLRLRRAQLAGQGQRLEALSPAAVLGRGFAIVIGPDGRVVRAARQVKSGDRLNVQVSDGTFGARVEE